MASPFGPCDGTTTGLLLDIAWDYTASRPELSPSWLERALEAMNEREDADDASQVPCV